MFPVVFLLTALSACSPFSIYHQSGVTVERMETDLLDCRVSAAQSVPVSNQLRREPPVYVPGRHYCRADGHCFRHGGYYLPGRTYTVDVNTGLRQDVIRQCMVRGGYTKTEIPACSQQVTRNAPRGVTRVLPMLDENSCVIRNEDKSWQIVTTG